MLAYIAAGLALGSNLGFGLIADAKSIEAIAHIGLMLLLFILGLEIDIKKLLKAGKAVLVNGVTQFAGCFMLGWLFFAVTGLAKTHYDLIYLAMAASLSSTLVVVKILSERYELDRFTSRITVGILVIQDLWAIIFLAIQPNLSDLRPGILFKSLGHVAILVAVSWICSRFLLPTIFAKASKLPELMLILVMSWCLAMAGVADALHLSVEMGALVAGVCIASYPYQADVASKVANLRDFFISLFFVSLGLQIPVPSQSVMLLSAGVVVFVVSSRLLTVYPVLFLMKYGNRASLIPSLNLGQLSEFALVVAALGVQYSHISPDMLAAFIMALAFTALLSSQIIPRTHAIYQTLHPWLEKIGLRDRLNISMDAFEQGHGHGHPNQVVFLGFYREASSLLHELMRVQSKEFLQSILVVDFNPETHAQLKKIGIHSHYGDIGQSDSLSHLHLDQAKMIICTVPDHLIKGTSNLQMLRNLKVLAPKAQIIVNAETLEMARSMYKEGAHYVYIPRLVGAHYVAEVMNRMLTGVAGNLSEAALNMLEKREEVMP